MMRRWLLLAAVATLAGGCLHGSPEAARASSEARKACARVRYPLSNAVRRADYHKCTGKRIKG